MIAMRTVIAACAFVIASTSLPTLASSNCQTRPVVMLGTTWCEHCRSARKFFRENGITFAEIDADKTTDPALRSMYFTDGVPQFDVENHAIMGFKESEIRAALCLPSH